MDPITGAAILGGVGLLQGFLGNQSAQDQQRKQALMRAEEIRASPWTKMAPSTEIKLAPSMASSLIAPTVGGVVSGLDFAQKADAQKATQKWLDMLENSAGKSAVAAAAPVLMSSNTPSPWTLGLAKDYFKQGT